MCFTALCNLHASLGKIGDIIALKTMIKTMAITITITIFSIKAMTTTLTITKRWC